MTNPKKPAAKSGDRRQPRLQDIERLESKVEQLTGQVEVLQAMVTAQAESASKSPCAGLDFDQAVAGLAFAAVSLTPGGVLDYQVAQRIKHAMRGFKAVLTGDDSLLQDKPKKRTRPTADARVTNVTPRQEPAISVSGGSAPSRNPNA